jgi:hypothetical protein
VPTLTQALPASAAIRPPAAARPAADDGDWESF